MSSKKTIQQRQAGLRVIILLAVLICINMLAARFHTGLDLTQERRFTLSQPTKKLMRNMDGVAVVEVLLEGKNLPAGFQRLKEAARERLQSLRDVSGGKVIFKFRDPFEGKAEDEKAAIFSTLADKGVNGVNIRQTGDESYSEQIVFPYALVNYKGKEQSVRLLENHLGLSPLAILNYSESLLEYKFASTINQLNRPDKPHIAVIAGHNEMISFMSYDALRTLQSLYKVDTFDLNSGTHINTTYEAAIVIKPIVPFDDKAKFKLDQYVMNGGKLIMLLDGVNAEMDSLRKEQQFLATPLDLNLDDMLFKWGARVNADLIEDLNCNPIPVVVGTVGDQPQFENHGWYYLPVFTPTSHHPIVNNMDAIMSTYPSSIDTIANPEIRKTVLLESSQYSRTTMAPTRVSLSMLRYAPKPELFNRPYRPAAVLLEGKFQSVFQDKLAPEFVAILRDSLHMPFKPVADSDGAVIIISDGDMFINGIRKNSPMEMGYWDVGPSRYANKSFMLNCMEYLTDKSGLLEARNKDVRLRLLDGGRVKTERKKWQTINIVIPLGLVLIFASAYIFFRRRRYEG